LDELIASHNGEYRTLMSECQPNQAWVRGEPTPFLPEKTTHTLTLRP
jgi:hypothetical protein